MRVASVHLRNYKRFADLSIEGIPETARLVVLIGPNGTGKSSVFDAFLLKGRAPAGNYRVSSDQVEYYEREQDRRNRESSTAEIADKVQIQFYGDEPTAEQWQRTFYIRTAYRHQTEFNAQQIRRTGIETSFRRFTRIIDRDEAVEENYSKMSLQLLSKVRQEKNHDRKVRALIDESEGEFQKALRRLFSEPPLELQDLDEIGEGTFRFTKGETKDFQYLNLSGGEKAAFDLLLDVFVKRSDFGDAIYCIDEPELHLATSLHGALLDEIRNMVPIAGQLWLATHSVGFVRRAYEIQRKYPDEVTFLDFSAHDFDKPVTLKPATPTPAFWKMTYQVALDNLSDLIAPEQVVLCEGGNENDVHGYDAQIYERVFAGSHPQTLFLTIGGGTSVHRGTRFVAMLQAVASGIDVRRIRDGDDMTDQKRKEMKANGTNVLGRREIENYLYDIAVLETFLRTYIDDESKIAATKSAILQIIGTTNSYTGEFKNKNKREDLAGKILNIIKTTTDIPKIGDEPRDFEVHHLAQALAETQNIFNELQTDVFG